MQFTLKPGKRTIIDYRYSYMERVVGLEPTMMSAWKADAVATEPYPLMALSAEFNQYASFYRRAYGGATGTRTHAQKLYQSFQGNPPVLHLN